LERRLFDGAEFNVVIGEHGAQIRRFDAGQLCSRHGLAALETDFADRQTLQHQRTAVGSDSADLPFFLERDPPLHSRHSHFRSLLKA